jgi:phage host-nuclease inhibitor protein Gam
MIINWTDFDHKLREIALLDLSVAEHARVRDLALVNAQTTFDASTASTIAIRTRLAGELETFYRMHRKEVEEVQGKKSVELTFGRAGLRSKAASVAFLKGYKLIQVIAAIKQHTTKWSNLIRTKESLNKPELKKLDADTLAKYGLKMKPAGDEFFFETFPEKAVGEAA